MTDQQQRQRQFRNLRASLREAQLERQAAAILSRPRRRVGLIDAFMFLAGAAAVTLAGAHLFDFMRGL